jgi:hypothetical protein
MEEERNVEQTGGTDTGDCGCAEDCCDDLEEAAADRGLRNVVLAIHCLQRRGQDSVCAAKRRHDRTARIGENLNIVCG